MDNSFTSIKFYYGHFVYVDSSVPFHIFNMYGHMWILKLIFAKFSFRYEGNENLILDSKVLRRVSSLFNMLYSFIEQEVIIWFIEQEVIIWWHSIWNG